ncbi:hypothetical protein NEAUS03_2259 [Nematocida ausubeli]|nr:hypothetical protein NEAUS03_2259 [Nematocida ausubeli]
MYKSQYSTVYNKRWHAQSQGLIEHSKENAHHFCGYLTSGKIFLVGTLEISYPKKKVISSYSKVSREIRANPIENEYYEECANKSVISNLQKEEESSNMLGCLLENAEYFLESPNLERIKLIISDEASEYLVDGVVIGVLGEKNNENHFVVDTIVHQADVAKENRISRPALTISRIENSSFDYADGTNSILLSTNAKNIQNIPKSVPIMLFDSLQEDTSVSNRVVLVPTPKDNPLVMIPWDLNMTPNNKKFAQKHIEAALSPSVIKVDGLSIGIVNINSIASMLKYHNMGHSAESYLKAMMILLKNMHLSPLSPYSCPAMPMETDSFIMQTLPHVLVLNCAFSKEHHVVINNTPVILVLLNDIPVYISQKEK